MVVELRKECMKCGKEFILRCTGEVCNLGLFCGECTGKPC